MKYLFKIIIVMIAIFMINNNTVQADQENFWDTVFNKGDSFIDQGKQEAQNRNHSSNVTKNDGTVVGVDEGDINMTQFKENWKVVYNVLFTLGIVLSVIMGAILVIKLMVGSIEQQVKAKELLIPYVLGCFVIFGAAGIWRIAMTVFSQFST